MNLANIGACVISTEVCPKILQYTLVVWVDVIYVGC